MTIYHRQNIKSAMDIDTLNAAQGYRDKNNVWMCCPTCGALYWYGTQDGLAAYGGDEIVHGEHSVAIFTPIGSSHRMGMNQQVCSSCQEVHQRAPEVYAWTLAVITNAMHSLTRKPLVKSQ